MSIVSIEITRYQPLMSWTESPMDSPGISPPRPPRTSGPTSRSVQGVDLTIFWSPLKFFFGDFMVSDSRCFCLPCLYTCAKLGVSTSEISRAHAPFLHRLWGLSQLIQPVFRVEPINTGEEKIIQATNHWFIQPTKNGFHKRNMFSPAQAGQPKSGSSLSLLEAQSTKTSIYRWAPLQTTG